MAKDQSDVLKELIKQAKDPKVIEQAKLALAEASQRKAEISARVGGSLGASEKLKEGASSLKDDKVAADIKDLLKESKDHTTSLKSLVKLNQKSIEDNSELFGRLEKTMSSLLDSIQEIGRDRSTNQQPNTAGFSRSVNASGGGNNPPGSGGFNIPDLGGFRRTIGGGANAAPTSAQPGKFSRFMRGAARIGGGAIGGGLLGGAVYGMMSPDQQAALNEMTGGNGDLALTGAGSVLGTAAAAPAGTFSAIGQGISKGAGYLARGATSLTRGAGNFLYNPFGAVAAGGAALSYGATKATQGEFGKQVAETIKNDPSSAAGAGEYALPAMIMHGPKKTEEEISKERDQLKDAPWYTRLYGIGKDKYLNRDAEASDIGNLGSNQAPINAEMLNPGVTPDISGVMMPAKETGGSIFTDIGNKIKGVTNEVQDAYHRGNRGTLEGQNLYKKSLEEWRQMGGEDSDTEGFMDYYDKKQKEAYKTGATTSGEEMLSASRNYEQTSTEEGGKKTSTDTMRSGITTEKSLFGSTTLGALVAEKGLNTGSFLGTGSDYQTTQDENGKEVTKSKMTELVGNRTSGGLLGADKHEIHEISGRDFITTDVTKVVYHDIQELVKDGKIDEASKKLQEFKRFMQESNANVGVTAMGDTGGMGGAIGKAESIAAPVTEEKKFDIGTITSKQLEGENQDYTKDIVPDDTQTDAVISRLAEMFNAKTAEKAASDEGSKAPIIVNNQGGDTINNVTNNTAGGSSGGAGSPSRMPGPWDAMTLGKSWEAYP